MRYVFCHWATSPANTSFSPTPRSRALVHTQFHYSGLLFHSKSQRGRDITALERPLVPYHLHTTTWCQRSNLGHRNGKAKAISPAQYQLFKRLGELTCWMSHVLILSIVFAQCQLACFSVPCISCKQEVRAKILILFRYMLLARTLCKGYYLRTSRSSTYSQTVPLSGPWLRDRLIWQRIMT